MWCVSRVTTAQNLYRAATVRERDSTSIMLTSYIRAAMRRAKFEVLPDDGTYFGVIPGFQGLYANAETLEACRQKLEETLEDWILLGISEQHPLPVVNGL